MLRGRSRFLDGEALVFDFWAAVHDDVDRETKAAFSAQLRFQSRGRRLILICPNDKAAPVANQLIAHGTAHVCVATQDYVFTAETRSMKPNARLPKL
ncbi:MAG: hypothetical protein ACR2KT_07405 [Methylocella sp.]